MPILLKKAIQIPGTQSLIPNMKLYIRDSLCSSLPFPSLPLLQLQYHYGFIADFIHIKPAMILQCMQGNNHTNIW
ncbi:MAG: hypothetical protein CVU50_02685 [Candidatus Cloacimonetes bacterium HGW-Cloacimonetes-3]|nr:MAG: hypothetical protein CVU50_02685 [Candidatus Cloacimonetes bacterium HGW-Cloacimonetes-3]